jgi:hypothetical protein
MLKTAAAIAIGALISAPAAFSQETPPPDEVTPSAPAPDVPVNHPLPGVSSDTTSVMVAPDPSTTGMVDPQAADEFGSPSAVESPGAPMPYAGSWPAMKPSAKRPKWVQKAPPSEAAPANNPHP